MLSRTSFSKIKSFFTMLGYLSNTVTTNSRGYYLIDELAKSWLAITGLIAV